MAAAASLGGCLGVSRKEYGGRNIGETLYRI